MYFDGNEFGLFLGLSDESQIKVQKIMEANPFELVVESDNFDLEEWLTMANCENYKLPFNVVKKDYIPIFPKIDYQ